MMPDRIARIPASAQCFPHGATIWSMSHPHPERLELRFPATAKVGRLDWWAMYAAFGVAVALYGWLSYSLLWPDYPWVNVKIFLGVSVFFWAWMIAAHPRGHMRIHELQIDRTTRTLAGTGVVRGRHVTFYVPMAAVTEVTYLKGSSMNSRPSSIEIEFLARYRKMRLLRLASTEDDLCEWLCAMLGKPTARG